MAYKQFKLLILIQVIYTQLYIKYSYPILKFIYYYLVSSNYSYLIMIICLHTVILFQAFLSNKNIPTDVQVQLLQVRVDLEVMLMKGFFLLLRPLEQM